MIFTKQAKRSTKGAIYAPGRVAPYSGSYSIYKLCENYDGMVRGGIRKTWRVVASGLSLGDAKALFEKKLGRKLY